MRVAIKRADRRRLPPVEYADAVESWARGHGTHARLVWDARAGNWDVRIDLPRSDDPRHQLEEPYEVVPILKPGEIKMPGGRVMPGLVGVELDEVGVAGIVAHLHETNLRTGRFRSAEEAIKYTAEKNRTERGREREFQKGEARHLARDEYRRVMQHPLIQGADLVATEKVAATTEDGNG